MRRVGGGGAWFASTTGTVVISHHGADEPAGTLGAYRTAYDRGYRWFQADLLAVKDDVLVAHAIFGRRRGFDQLTVAQARAKLGHDAPTLSELLDDAHMPVARWNVELKHPSALPHLLTMLVGDPALRSRVLVSAPFHRSIGDAVRKALGTAVPVAAPWVGGGTFGVELITPSVPYDCVQVHRWFARRARRRLGDRPVHVWTIRTRRQLRAALRRGQHPIVQHSDAEARRWYESLRAWPKPLDVVASGGGGAPDGAAPSWEITQVFLGGGGWRGAFGSIGTIAFLDHDGRWPAVRDVVAISGGSFITALLASAGPAGASPTPVLADAVARLLSMAGPMRWRAATLAGLLPLVLVPPAWPVLLIGARALLSWQWRILLGATFPEAPRSDGERRYIVCAAGRESAARYSFVATSDPLQTPMITTRIVPPGWTIVDAIASSTALPWVTGYRTPDTPNESQPGGVERGERLVDGGILGIFGTQTFDVDPLTSVGDDQRALVLDAGRIHRRGSRVVERVTSLSTVALMGRWVQIGLDGSFRRSVREALDNPPPPTEEPLPVHLIRIAEADPADPFWFEPGGPVMDRIAPGRKLVHGVGLTGLTKENAVAIIVVAFATTAIDLRPTISVAEVGSALADVGPQLGFVAGELEACWDALALAGVTTVD